ncbi:hypothetical protein [Mesorhizobium sp.]|uniref:hypothetical protein n=1 Tax=Mesorhizobium sp. TaxID=1871066 RepID=UPI000FEA473C|nr:hypothetical protein [Mesorhizobium sp.]RWA66611.1 MAG: hypothetical protein EOQ27_02210 [Mesorhizobium sp.]
MREEQRRLAAILAADVAGYSRLMATDESGTLGRLRRLGAEVFEPKIARPPVAAIPFYFVWWTSVAHHKSIKSTRWMGFRRQDLANRTKKLAISH